MAVAATAQRLLHRRGKRDHRLKPSPYNNRRWKAASRAFRSRPENVWCAECRKHGRLRRSTQTDHVIPHRGDQTLFWDEANWQALCDRCHSRKTRRQQRESQSMHHR